VPFTYSVGNRILLSAIIRQMLGAAGQQQETKVLGGLDKLKKIGPDGVTDIVAALPGMDRAAVTDLVRFVQSQAKGVDQSAVENLLRTDAAAAQELARYVRTIEILQQHSARQAIRGTIVADLSLARGLGYYTGVVFEGTVNQLPGIGSISGGGRYNQLVSRFSNREFAGVGGSVGVDRVLAALEELGLDADQARRGVFVAIATGDALGYGFEILSQVRAAGLRSDIGMQPGKLGNQFKHADRLHYAYVITVGSEEMSRREFSMKDLQTGAEQRGMALADLDSTLRSSTNR
jgi:histidyl-tRNA synthetase